jgi:protease I
MTPDTTLRGRKIAILAEDMYEDLELWYPLFRMKEAGADVVVVGPSSNATYASKHGYEVKSDLSAEEAQAKQFDAVIIPGGYAPDRMRRSAAMVKFVREAHDGGKVVAAICHAGWMLASAGVLKGRNATCFKSIRDDVVNAGANYVDREVVRDGNLITSRFPADLPAFCTEIISALSEKSKIPAIQARK